MPPARVEMPHHTRQFPEGLHQSPSSEVGVMGGPVLLGASEESQWDVQRYSPKGCVTGPGDRELHQRIK